MPDLILYSYFRSSTAYRARIALHLKNLEFETRAIHLLKNDQHTAEYKRLNPRGEVPTLIHRGQAVAQSLAVIEYLDEVFPGTKLYPADPLARARVRQFCENINSGMHPLGNLKVTQYLEKKNGYDQPAKEEWSRHWFAPGFEALEAMLSAHAGTYCFGNEVTAADICLVPAIFAARRVKLDFTPYPIAMRVAQAAEELPAFKKAHPFRQPDTPAEERI